MMTAKRAKKLRTYVFAIVRKLVDPDTGELVAAFVPSHGIDRRICREKRCHANSEWRIELRKPRNPKFFRKAHSLGLLCAAQIDKFHGKDGHAVLKELQRESGVCCDLLELDLGQLGKVPVNEARSLSFDDMEETEFEDFWTGITRYLIATYWPNMTPEEIEHQAEFITND